MDIKDYTDVYFWRDVPIDVDVKLYNALASIWQGKISEISFSGLSKEREECGYLANNNKYFTYYYKDLPQEKINEILNDASALHVFSGFKGYKEKYIKYFKDKSRDVVVLCERPNYFGGGAGIRLLKKILLDFQYKSFAKKYAAGISLLITYGEIGVKTYKRLGFNEDKIVPFMYNSECDDIERDNKERVIKPIKLLYIGRFDYSTKGLDLLIKAMNKRHDSQLTLVGGYGKNKDDVFKKIKKSDNIIYEGKWDKNEVVEKMSHYDLCIIPSRYDGYNINVNHAAKAGIGCIITDRAGSGELVKYGEYGLVIKSNGVAAISKALDYCENNLDQIEIWKNNAIEYSKYLKIEDIARYFKELLNYANQKNDKIPLPPWVK